MKKTLNFIVLLCVLTGCNQDSHINGMSGDDPSVHNMTSSETKGAIEVLQKAEEQYEAALNDAISSLEDADKVKNMNEGDIKQAIQQIESNIRTRFDSVSASSLISGLTEDSGYKDYLMAYQKLANVGRNLDKKIQAIEKILNERGNGTFGSELEQLKKTLETKKDELKRKLDKKKDDRKEKLNQLQTKIKVLKDNAKGLETHRGSYYVEGVNQADNQRQITISSAYQQARSSNVELEDKSTSDIPGSILTSIVKEINNLEKIEEKIKEEEKNKKENKKGKKSK